MEVVQVSIFDYIFFKIQCIYKPRRQLVLIAIASSSRRQSLDMLWSAGTGERVKEFLNHGMMMLNISSLTERRSNEPKITERDKEKCEKFEKIEGKGKKVPSPLEKTMTYLNADEETSDSESLARCVSLCKYFII